MGRRWNMSWGTENDLGAQEMDQKTSGQILSTSIVDTNVRKANKKRKMRQVKHSKVV